MDTGHIAGTDPAGAVSAGGGAHRLRRRAARYRRSGACADTDRAESPEKAQKQKKHKEKKNPPEKQKAAPREKRKLGLTPGDIRSALPYLWQSLKGALRKTRQRLRIDPMQVSVILGGEEDPAASAETYGWVSAAVWTFMPRLEELMRIPDPYIHLDVDYSAAETKAEGEVGLSFQIRDLFAIGFAFGIPVLKWLLRWKKEKKLREEAQKAEIPKSPRNL